MGMRTCGCAPSGRFARPASIGSRWPESARSATPSATSRTAAIAASPAGRAWWASVLDPAVVAANLAVVREHVGEGVEILAATKYVSADELPALHQAGV